MDWRNPAMAAKRSLSEEKDDGKRKEDNNTSHAIHHHEGTIFNPSPDTNRISLDPVRIDPDPIRTTRPEPVIRYRECQKNHAAHLGSHVLDGCGEFMPDGDDGTLESLTCAACGCHRNFHRKDAGDGLVVAPGSNFQISLHQHGSVLAPFPFRQAPAGDHRHRRFSSDQAPAPGMMSFGEGESEDLGLFRSDGEGYGGVGSSRKRFRTKFTTEQKERMMELAERIGWRIQKEDESEVQRFCATNGVKRQVFKVWMHNNKQAMKRKQSS